MRTRYLLFTLFCAAVFGQVGESLLKGLQYRPAGPFRGGRVLAVSGIPGDPRTYYFGAAAGGVRRLQTLSPSSHPATLE